MSKEEYNLRKEITCSKCGKSRMLSLKEAEEDGWVFNTQYKGIICFDCKEKYGLPAIFIAGIPARVMASEGGFTIEFDNSQERFVKQTF